MAEMGHQWPTSHLNSENMPWRADWIAQLQLVMAVWQTESLQALEWSFKSDGFG